METNEHEMYTRETAKALLPEVGDHLIRKPELHRNVGAADVCPMPCVVDYVNREHLWYRVRFEAGYTQCYKVPGGGIKE